MDKTYRAFVSEEIQPWLNTCVKEGEILSKDGIHIHYCKAVNPHEKAAVLMVHGFCEFFGKYHETAMRFYQAGYSIFFLELRGHGKSDRSVSFPDERVYVKSFDEYVSDIHVFYEQIVTKESLTHRCFLFAHSMGGTASALYLEEYLHDFDCAVLSSPMLKVNYGKIPPLAVDALAIYSKAAGKQYEYAPGQSSFTGRDEFEKSSSMDYDRYLYQLHQRISHPEYQTWGGTMGWCAAAKKGTEKALGNAELIQIPVLLLQAGADTMVDLEGQNRFQKKCPKATLIVFPEAKHELFNGTETIRKNWYKDVIDYFDAYAK